MGPVLNIQLLKRIVMNYGLSYMIFFLAACRCTGDGPVFNIPLFSPPDFALLLTFPDFLLLTFRLKTHLLFVQPKAPECNTSQASQLMEQFRTWRAYLIAGAAPLTPVHTYHQAVWPPVNLYQ